MQTANMSQCAVFYLLVILATCVLAPLIGAIAFFVPWIPGILIPVSTGIFFASVIIGFMVPTSRSSLWNIAKFSAFIPLCFWLALFVLGHLSLVGARFFNVRMSSTQARFPLAHLDAIAVDSRGQIYCLSLFYCRVQVFDEEGNFVRGWFVPIPKGLFRMMVDDQDNLRIAARKNGVNLFFDSNGNLVKKEKKTDFDEEFGLRQTPKRVKDNFGNIYEIRSPYLFPKVVKISLSDEQEVFIRDHLGLWVITMPLPAFGFFALTFAILIITRILVAIK